MTGEKAAYVLRCANCGCRIKEDPPGYWSHIVAGDSSLRRCDPANSGQPYGLEATLQKADEESS